MNWFRYVRWRFLMFDPGDSDLRAYLESLLVPESGWSALASEAIQFWQQTENLEGMCLIS